jgi:hypothetical protein
MNRTLPLPHRCFCPSEREHMPLLIRSLDNIAACSTINMALLAVLDWSPPPKMRIKCNLVTRSGIEKTLSSSGALPPLNGAPVGSWLLARIAFLSGKRFPFSYGQVVGSDGADYFVRFYCVVSPATRAGVLLCCGSPQGISFGLGHPRGQQGDRTLDAFVH